ncbi:MAG: hypothetical protein NTZ67_04265 [Gammaproteobacteria bacterium]|nr:hypothetical protein [Gammaproteobacteria bacterium]
MRTHSEHKHAMTTLNLDFKARRREFFESRLATLFLDKLNDFTSVKKISTAIANLIEENKTTVLNIIAKEPKITDDLRAPFFGSCYGEHETISPEKALEDILFILKNPQGNSSTIMQIHCIFEHRIHGFPADKIDEQTKESLQHTLSPASLFNSSNRSRAIKTEKATPTKQLGFAQNPVFSKMTGESQQTHLRAIDKFQAQQSSHFFKAAAETNSPVICGPSGHTKSLLIGASLYGNLSSPDEVSEYAFACFAFLAAGGNHSFHEVMVIANLIGVHYEAGNYANSISTSLKATDVYQNLCEQFPEFLEEMTHSALQAA